MAGEAEGGDAFVRKDAAETGCGDGGCGPVVDNQGGAGRSGFGPDAAGEISHICLRLG